MSKKHEFVTLFCKKIKKICFNSKVADLYLTTL